MNRTPTVGILVVGVASAVVLGAGCMNLEPKPDPTVLYTLSGPDLPRSEEEGSLRIGLRRIDIPAYLDTKKIVTRRGANEVSQAEFHRWAEGFESTLKRAIGEHLSAQPGVGSVRVYPWTGSPEFDVAVTIQILRFEGADDGRVRLAADWQLQDLSQGETRPPRSTHLEGSWTPGDYGGLVQELENLLAQWIAEIASDL